MNTDPLAPRAKDPLAMGVPLPVELALNAVVPRHTRLTRIIRQWLFD